MSIPTFEFLQRDAAHLAQPKKFTDALIASGRFYRDERGLVKLKVGDGDYAVIDSKRTLREILISGEAIALTGDLDATAFDTMWLWFGARRWTFPRLNPERPWSPEKPLPLRYVGQVRR
jgi:hypothetical protein